MTTTQGQTITIDIVVGYQDIDDQTPMARATRWTEDYTGRRDDWTYTITVDAEMAADFLVEDGVAHLADQVFQADNAPYVFDEDSAAGMIQAAMNAAYTERQGGHHSLSVGDTVRVGEVTVVCASTGWVRVRS